ncbi:hypothetical protein OS242_06910 [Tumebacillus sp. DT12]|uniref:LXG domain-containing protein n=1 Tax=Tumebacillus lacus TaxID=2995335 RepID=A0ABT3WYD0_9BACL|nr:hypothetical protein [Tumebacillus lacus]MCX7569690.1 hypothetical protein [Tumebacillus lacus]
MRQLADPAEIRRGAQTFAFRGNEMFEHARQIERIANTLTDGTDGWDGEGADAFRTVAEHLRLDAGTAGSAFQRAGMALQSLASQLDYVNQLYRQADQLEEEIASLHRSYWGADEIQRASIDERIVHRRQRLHALLQEAEMVEIRANQAASAAFDEVSAMANRVFFANGGQVGTVGGSLLDKAGDYFKRLWASETFKNSPAGVLAGLFEGIGSFIVDELEALLWVSPAYQLDQALRHPDVIKKKVSEIFHDMTHPDETLQKYKDGFRNIPGQIKVISLTIKESWDRDIINGTGYSRAKWGGYALGVAAETFFTGGTVRAAKTGAEVVDSVADVNRAVRTYRDAHGRAYEDLYARHLIEGDSFEEILDVSLTRNGITRDEFFALKQTSTAELSASEAALIKAIRMDVPAPVEGTLMQKVIYTRDFAKYLSGDYQSVGGFLTNAHDTKRLDKSHTVLEGLRLDYGTPETNPFLKPNGEFTDEPIYLMRFSMTEPEKVRIPFGGADQGAAEKMHGRVLSEDDAKFYTDAPPFTGNGFTKSEAHIVPEYKSRGFIRLSDGDSIYELSFDGTEKLRAVYAEDLKKFIEVNHADE